MARLLNASGQMSFLKLKEITALKSMTALRARDNRLLVSGLKSILYELPLDVEVQKLLFVRRAMGIDVNEARRAIQGGLLDRQRKPVCGSILKAEAYLQCTPDAMRKIYELDREPTSLHTLGELNGLLDLMALVSVPTSKWSLDVPKTAGRRILVLHGLQDPGNVGSLIRTSVAFGFDEIWITSTSSTSGVERPDRIALNAKAVRATKGAILHASVVRQSFETCLQYLARHHVQTFVADVPARGAKTGLSFSGMREPDPRKPLALILSNEGQGISSSVPTSLPRVGIAMPAYVDSLNVAAAGAALMFALQTPA